MSERKARTARQKEGNSEESKTNPPSSLAEGLAAVSETQSEEAPKELKYPGVVLFRVPVESQPGSEELKIMPINGMDPFAVPTLLRKAATIQEQQLGL